MAACKEKSIVKPDLIPPVDNIHTFEVKDFNMTVNNLYYDSIWTNDKDYRIVSIGALSNDPFFGKTQAGLYIQFLPPSEGFAFPTGTIIDSALVSLPFNNFKYADTASNSTLSLKAYEITDPFALGDGTRKYYAFNRVSYKPTAIGAKTFTLKSLRDTVPVFRTDTIGGLLRMRLSDAFCEQFRSMPASATATNASFLDFFRGIYLGPDSTVQQNTIASFALAGASTNLLYSGAQMEFFYHTSTNDTVKRALFPYNSLLCSFFNGIYHNYTGAPVQAYLSNQQASRDSVVLQGYPGFRSDITVPIDPAAIPPSIINKATLTMTVLKVGDDARFSAPPQLIIRGVNDNGQERPIADLLNGDDSTTNTSGAAFVGATAFPVLIGGSTYLRYTFNIPREFQKAVSAGQTQLKLRLIVPTAYQGAYRLVADGPRSANTDTRLSFNVIYTKLN
ncbi:DUF4270 domain-containing protein [Taibaiella helva]|uniref:DUF4270 domain-containing protein n=1 Tax=Taibaiella helva TaxID=2301235 RepID=UPI0021CFD277|nr:DUF4270 domain-containing protein [Taibaiella helva]